MAAAAIVATLQIVEAIEPGLIALGRDFVAMLTKHPAMTPEQLVAFQLQYAAQIHQTNADTLATIQQDQAKPTQE